MVSELHPRWQTSFAVIQTLGAIVAVVSSFLHPSASVWARVVWSVVAVGLIGACISWFVNKQERPVAVSNAGQPAPHAATPSNNGGTTRNLTTRRIHYLVPLTLWSALASMVVVYMSSHQTALLLISLAPLWIGLTALGATAVISDRTSAIAMTVLSCGLLGAWLGSNGDSATRLGFVWYALAGFLVSGVLVSRDSAVSLATTMSCTILFVLLTVLIMGRDDYSYAFLHPASCVRTGAPFFAFGLYLALSGRWMFGIALTRYAGLRNALARIL
jgi:hypothetical protein